MAASMCLILLAYVTSLRGDVHIATNGVPWMCNSEPKNTQKIAPLSASDQQLIHQLEQVQVFHRHGARTGTVPIASFLPNTSLEYNCNITSVETREYKEHNFYTNASKTLVNIRKLYVEDEQLIEGNCREGQSLQYLILQHQANAHHIKQAYIGNDAYHLFNSSTLHNIRKNLSLYSKDSRISLTSTDFERTIASLTVLISELLFDGTQNSEDITIDVNIHDHLHDPVDGTKQCANEPQFQQWNALFNADTSSAADEVIESQFARDTIAAFTNEGGIWSVSSTGHELLYPYCAGMKLPLNNDTFWNALQLSYYWDTAFVNTSDAKEKTECYYNFMNVPMLYSMHKNINKMMQHSSPRLVFYSVHDSTLIRLYESLGIYDHHLIIFAEMVTLEIYSAANDTDLYYFRIMRKGQFVPYPSCDYMDDETELCDLDILFERSFKSVVPYHEWIDECATLLTDCVCGYCEEEQHATTETSDDDKQNTNDVKCSDTSGKLVNVKDSRFWIGIGIGLVIGAILSISVMMMVQKGYCAKKEGFVGTQYVLDQDTYKL